MSINEEKSIKTKLITALTQQLSEYELLKAMYPRTGDIILTDSKVLDDINTFLENNSVEYMPNHLDFIVNLHLEEIKLEVCVNLPSFYPNEEPELYVRCNQLKRQQESSLNTQLSNYVKSNFNDEVCIYSAISWLQDNIDTFLEKNTTEDLTNPPIKCNESEKFVRLWIYSHHIYNKRKRDEIVSRAKELKLTGFCLPGKPGIICVEGPETDCLDWWIDIKAMTWKKINLKTTETFNITDEAKERKFIKFEEIVFQAPANRNKHSDTSGLSKYMEKHGLSEIFKELFGFNCEA